MNISMQLISKITDYVSHRITLRDLESWIVARLPILLSSTDNEVERLVATIELCLAELHGGIRPERSIRLMLARRLPRTSMQQMIQKRAL